MWGGKDAVLQMMFWCLQNFNLVIENNLDFSFTLQLVLVLGDKEGKEVFSYTYNIFCNTLGYTESSLLYFYHKYVTQQHKCSV